MLFLTSFNLFFAKLFFKEIHSYHLQAPTAIDRVKTLVGKIGRIAELVLECASKQPGSLRSKWGLTSVSALVSFGLLKDRSAPEIFNHLKYIIYFHTNHQTHEDLRQRAQPRFFSPSMARFARLTDKRCSLEPLTDDERSLPASFNWVEKGIKSPVRNQGGSRLCTLFAVMGSLEGVYQIAHPNEPPKEIGRAHV